STVHMLPPVWEVISASPPTMVLESPGHPERGFQQNEELLKSGSGPGDFHILEGHKVDTGDHGPCTLSHRHQHQFKALDHISRTQEHLDAITPQGPRSTRKPSHHKDPGAPGRHHTTRSQEHPDTFTTQAMRWDPGAPDAIGLGGPRCNQTILDQENPEVPQTSLDQEIPEAPIIL
ncbi:hypothetical protein STEG23_024000, partial [Scotinomys teguina]